MSILEHFTKGKTPRAAQVTALETVEREWSKADVFVVEIPVGGGKSDVAMTLARWANEQRIKSLILTPNNILLQQYQASNPKLATLMGRANYRCHNSTSAYEVRCGDDASGYTVDVGPRGGRTTKPCPNCPAEKSKRRLLATPYGVTNYHMTLAFRGQLSRELLIFDEAHNLLSLVRDLAARVIWRFQANYPSSLSTYSDVLNWLQGIQPNCSELYRELTSGQPKWLIEKGTKLYRGSEQDCLKLLPIDTSKEPPFLWPPSKVKKLVLMSATIGPKDLEQLGLDKKRVCWVSTPSPIPPQRRPVVVHSPGFDLSFSSLHSTGGEGIGQLANWLLEKLEEHKEERGVIHVTYALMDAVKARLAGRDGGRVLYHTRDNKRAVYQQFLDAGGNSVLMCAGLYEGIDLPGDLGRWQVICKVPWPSMAEPAWKWVAETDRERYAWETLRVVMQGAGRVCRGPEDFGVTYVADKSFNSIPKELMPSWFREALDAGRLL